MKNLTERLTTKLKLKQRKLRKKGKINMKCTREKKQTDEDGESQ